MFFLQYMTEKLRRIGQKDFPGKGRRDLRDPRKLQTVSMKKLVLQSVAFTADPVKAFAPVFKVPHKRMSF